MGRPARGWRTLGSVDRMRFPCPAANMTIFINNNYMSLSKPLQTIKITAICCLILLITACSTVKFAYNQGDTLIRWWIDDHIGLTAEQEFLTRELLEQQFWWHRTEQLTDVSKTLEQLRRQLNRPLSAQEVSQFSDDLKKFIYTIAKKTTPDAAKIFVTLQSNQIEKMQKRMQKGNEKFVKEWLPPSIEKQNKVRADKVIDRVEWLFGSINKEQEEKIRQHIKNNPLDMSMIYQERVRRQNDLIRIVKSINQDKLNQQQAEDLLAVYIKNFEYGTSKEQLEFGKKRSAVGVQLSSFITQIMNDDQRKYASGRVETWASDVQDLIRESSVLAAKRSALPNR
jgi:hypothetical protein